MVGQAGGRRHHDYVTDGQHRIHSLIDCFEGLDVKVKIDTPIDPTGEWWIDFYMGDYSTVIAWQADKGFGIFTSDEDAYGARPDEVYREPELAARRLKQLAAGAMIGQTAMRLSDVRKLLEKSQSLLAKSLKRDQGFISKLEHQDDALLSSIKSYVEALGGEMKLVVQFDGFEAPIAVPSTSKRTAGRHGTLRKRAPKSTVVRMKKARGKRPVRKSAALTCG